MGLPYSAGKVDKRGNAYSLGRKKKCTIKIMYDIDNCSRACYTILRCYIKHEIDATNAKGGQYVLRIYSSIDRDAERKGLRT